MNLKKEKLILIFEKWCKKLIITPNWDVFLRLVEDTDWDKTDNLKVDCNDKKAILLLNVFNPK